MAAERAGVRPELKASTHKHTLFRVGAGLDYRQGGRRALKFVASLAADRAPACCSSAP